MPYGYDFTEIELTTLVTGKPVKAMQGLAMYQNAIAIAEGAVGAPRVVRGALSTVTNSVSGSLTDGDSVTISLGAGAFFPNIAGTNGDGLQVRGAPSSSTNPDNAQIQLHNASGATRTYNVAWRRIEAS